jgi:hypothetical protein
MKWGVAGTAETRCGRDRGRQGLIRARTVGLGAGTIEDNRRSARVGERCGNDWRGRSTTWARSFRRVREREMRERVSSVGEGERS